MNQLGNILKLISLSDNYKKTFYANFAIQFSFLIMNYTPDYDYGDSALNLRYYLLITYT